MEETYIKILVADIEKKYGWGSSSNWTNHQFIVLSSDIEKNTGKKVSESTLKRILGKKKTSKEVYMPQLYTKNTLAEFIGYQNWEEYRKTVETDKGAIKYDSSEEKQPQSKKGIWSVIKNIFAGQMPKATIYCANPVSRVPCTSIFHYDVSHIKEDVMADFGQGYTVPLPRDKHLITEFFGKADYLDVRVVTKDDQELARLKLHLLSKGWQGGYAMNNLCRVYKAYEDQTFFREHGRLYVSPSQLLKRNINWNGECWTEYRYFDDFNIEMDNMSAEIIARNNAEEGGKPYYDIELLLFGEKGNIIFRFIAPNAHCYVDLEFSEKKLNGRYNDLAAFSRDTSEWRTIGMKSTGKNVQIFFDHSQVYQCSYEKAIGRMKGISVRFYGCGSLKKVKLANQHDVTVFEDDFKNN